MNVRHTLQIMIALLAGLMLGFIGGLFSPEQAQATTIVTVSHKDGGESIGKELFLLKRVTSGNHTGAFDNYITSQR